jgi:hypothetical protein
LSRWRPEWQDAFARYMLGENGPSGAKPR